MSTTETSQAPTKRSRPFLLTGEGWPYLLVPFIPVAIVLEFLHADAVAVFAASALGVIPTAALMGRATEELAARSGPGIGGLLNVTFGNAPELIIALFALGAGLHEVVKASLVGSILGNILLVLGVSMLAGGLRTGAAALRAAGGHRPVTHAAAGDRGAGDAGDLPAGSGWRAAQPNGQGCGVLQRPEVAVSRGRSRAAGLLCGRAGVLPEDPRTPVQPLPRRSRAWRRAVDGAQKRAHAGCGGWGGGLDV